MEESRKGGLATVWWIIAGVMVAEITARFLLEFDLTGVLLVEVVVFMIAAVLLNSFAVRNTELSERSRTLLLVLALAFVFGALRSGLWLAGLEVQWANLTTLVAALTLFTLWWRRRKSAR